MVVGDFKGVKRKETCVVVGDDQTFLSPRKTKPPAGGFHNPIEGFKE